MTSPSDDCRGVRVRPFPAILLTLAALALVALPLPISAAVPADSTYSGQSYITPQRFPCPTDFKCAGPLEHMARLSANMPVTQGSVLGLRTTYFADAFYILRRPTSWEEERRPCVDSYLLRHAQAHH